MHAEIVRPRCSMYNHFTIRPHVCHLLIKILYNQGPTPVSTPPLEEAVHAAWMRSGIPQPLDLQA